MIRFVDMREAEIEGHRFAFWCTINDKWLTLGGYEAWDDWTDFRQSYMIEHGPDPALYQRYLDLAPGWTVHSWNRDRDNDPQFPLPKETA